MKRNQVLFEDYFLRKEILRVAKLFRVPMPKEPYRQHILTYNSDFRIYRIRAPRCDTHL